MLSSRCYLRRDAMCRFAFCHPLACALRTAMLAPPAGPSFAPATACASGAHAIGEAYRMIR